MQINGRAERVIKTIMEIWHDQETFSSRKSREISLVRFYNSNIEINNMTSYGELIELQTPLIILAFYGLTEQSSANR